MSAVVMFPRAETREFRALQLAVVASLALHAFVLFVAPGIRAPVIPPALPTLTAVLRALPQPSEPAPAAIPQPRQETEAPRAPVESRPKTETSRPPPPATPKIAVASPVPSPAAAAAAPQSPAVTAPTTETKSAAPASAPPTTVASAAPSSAAASADAADPDALQGYKVQLAAFAQKYQRYPPLARERNVEGISYVKLTIGANGRILDTTITTSSGSDLLDKSAIEATRKAAPLTEIKPALRNKEFSIILPFVFNLTKKEGG